MLAVLLLSCGGEAPQPPPEPSPSSLNMNPSTLEKAVFEMTDVIGYRWSESDGNGWLDLCFVREGAPPTSATSCSVEPFTMVNGHWHLRVHHRDETSAYRIIMVSPSSGGYSLRLTEGEARFSHADRSSGVVQWKTPIGEGLYQR